MFNDHAFRDRVQLSGVNSINWARIVAQVTYYFVAACRARRAVSRRSRSPCRPAISATFLPDTSRGAWGCRSSDLIIASNANDILPRTAATGVYEMRNVIATSSPSMDIQISSNFERYLFEASGRDAAKVRGLMSSLAQSRRFELGAELAHRIEGGLLGAGRIRSRRCGVDPRYARSKRVSRRTAHGMWSRRRQSGW